MILQNSLFSFIFTDIILILVCYYFNTRLCITQQNKKFMCTLCTKHSEWINHSLLDAWQRPKNCMEIIVCTALNGLVWWFPESSEWSGFFNLNTGQSENIKQMSAYRRGCSWWNTRFLNLQANLELQYCIHTTLLACSFLTGIKHLAGLKKKRY